MNKSNILKSPDYITIETNDTTLDTAYTLRSDDSGIIKGDVKIEFKKDGTQLHVSITAQESAVKFVRLRWNSPFTPETKFMGDAWERSYGDLEWRGFAAARQMPWYFFSYSENTTTGYGVKVRPSSFCFWQADEAGVTLWIDVRNGGQGVHLNGRKLNACTIVSEDYSHLSPFDAACRFCKIMCTDPLLPDEPIYGSNNFYYAYGISSHQEILSDTAYLNRLVDENEPNRPFMVIDDGWQFAHDLKEGCNGGPWDRGNYKFPDMKGLATEIKSQNIRPGIWVRLLKTSDKETLPKEWLLADTDDILDPSFPQVLDHIRNVLKLIHSWGYELIKHDFTTFDLFGLWGFEMNPYMTNGDWHFADQTKTSAEIIITLYKTILEGASGSYVLGCNCIGHLGAGYMHMHRIGDDTSGKHWERTRLIGPNTLAFRMPQHRSFYDIDADCIGIMGTIPWKYNKQWLHLLSNSGTAFFVSAKPGIMTEQEITDMKEAMKIAAKQASLAEPLDWLNNNCPSKWRINGETVSYDWYEASGLLGFGFDIK